MKPPLAHPTLVLLGNSTVRLIPTDGQRLRLNAEQTVPTAEFLGRALSQLPRAARALLAAPHPLVVCSVQRACLAKLRAAAKKTGQPLHLYGVAEGNFGPGLPLRLAPDGARTVGRDRLAACVAALAEFPQGALVCDIGTALTINRVTPRGFVGGLIAPGVQMALASLHHGTSQLPAVTAATAVSLRAARFPAKTTDDALRLGALTAVAGAIERVYRIESAAFTPEPPGARKSPAKRATPTSLPLILTGGGGIMIRPLLAPKSCWRPHLVATGVWQMFLRHLSNVH